MQEAEDEPLFAERAAGIDIAKAGIEVTIRVPSDTLARRPQQETRSFRTTLYKDLLALADWLRCWQVTKVGMESLGTTGSRCTSCWNRRALTACCTTPRRSRRCPGRPKTDKLDSVLGLRRSPSCPRCRAASCPRRRSARCAPTPRYRMHLTQVRTAKKARVEKLLEDAHLEAVQRDL